MRVLSQDMEYRFDSREDVEAELDLMLLLDIVKVVGSAFDDAF